MLPPETFPPTFPSALPAHLPHTATPRPAHRRGIRRFLPDSAALTTWEVVFLTATGILTASIGFKLASIQYLEYIYFIQILVLANAFGRRGYRLTWFRPYIPIGALYLIFAIAAFALAVASLRFQFQLPANLEPLRYPVVITVSRLVELFANVSIMLFLADLFRRSPAHARFLLRVYFWTGVASAIYSLVSLPLLYLGFTSFAAYSIEYRVRGFYNEGGPYGLYLFSVFLVAWALHRFNWERQRLLLIGSALMLLALIFSASKAAAFAIILMLLFNGLFAHSLFRRFVIIAVGLVAIVVFSRSSTVELGLRIYRQASESYERLSLLHRNDANYVNGRVAGIFIVPRMIAAHPLTGIGWGNYTVARNEPEYRGASAFSVQSFTEEAGLGLYGLTADLGIPLMCLLLVCLFYPFVLLRSRRAPLYLANLALVQPVVHLAGAQLNSTFPWIVTGAALGLLYANPSSENEPPPEILVS